MENRRASNNPIASGIFGATSPNINFSTFHSHGRIQSPHQSSKFTANNENCDSGTYNANE